MALYNLARMTTSTVGTGPVTVGSAVNGYLTFIQAGVPNGATVSYGLADGSNCEVGTGVFSGGVLTRTPLVSSNANALIPLSGGAQVYITALAGVDFCWIFSGNNIYNLNSANVGIGTTTPAYPLDVKGIIAQAGTPVLVSVTAFGADPSGVADSTTAFRNALATGKAVYIPTGTYLISGDLSCTVAGQAIFGDSSNNSIIKIASAAGFSNGVFVATGGLTPGPYCHDFQVNFIQPDTSSRAGLTNYQPAFFFRQCPRFRLQNVRVQCAMVAIDMQGNSGGAYITNCEISAFNAQIIIDGSQDTVRITDCHFWPFGMTTNQQSIYNQYGVPVASGNPGYIASSFSGTTGICTGRMDGLNLKGCVFLMGGPQLYHTPGTGGPGGVQWLTGDTIGNAATCNFDSYSGIYWAGGSNSDFSLSGCYWTNASTAYSMQIYGGHIAVSASWFYAPQGASVPPTIFVNGGNLAMSGNYIGLGATTNAFIIVEGAGSNLVFSGNMVSASVSFSSSVLVGESGYQSINATGNNMISAVTSAAFINYSGGSMTAANNNGASGWSNLNP